MHWTRIIGWLALPGVCLLAIGCQRQQVYDPTYPVSGTVTLDKNPLADGVMNFITPETGDLQVIPIKDGRFEGQVRAGKRRVEIRAYPVQKGPPKPMAAPPMNYLPAKYNSSTTLSADVATEGPNVFDFDLKLK
jgi:hypothetical protein